jgi:hypothetical protein
MPCPGKCISVLMRFCLYAFKWDFLFSEDKDSAVWMGYQPGLSS